MNNTCPSCRSKKTRLLWEKVVFCENCNLSSLIDEDRYTLACPDDWAMLVPRENYPTPTLVCMKCGKEYRLPGESDPEIVEEEL